jgi:hypothetical protein
MNSSPPNPLIGPGKPGDSPAPSLRSIVRKSALLNVVIVLTSFPVLAFAGGLKAVVPALEIMAGISVLIWTSTFALFSFVTFPRIFRAPASLVKPSAGPCPGDETEDHDRWLDGPV